METKKKKKLIDLTVIEEFLESGVSAIALVENPAIEVDFFAFQKEQFVEPRAGESENEFIGRCMSKLVGDEGKEQSQAAAICYSYWRGGMEQQFATYTDYPEAAKANAQRALDYAAENGWGSCGTAVGKIRANQLAKGEPISEDTISRMASFARHQQNSDTPYGEGCGKLMWDAWGGTEGIEWASRKLEEIRKEKMEIEPNPCWEGYEPVGLKRGKDGKMVPNCIPVEYAAECPPATVDIALNLKNRQTAIDTAHYGPLDPNLPNEDYWKAKAAMFGDDIESAKKALCGNCSFFNVGKAIEDCIAAGIGTEGGDPYEVIDAGQLGYCEAFDFKCAAARTCDAWVTGGPVEMDIVVNAPPYIDQTGATKKKKKKPILEAKPVLASEDTLLAYFSQVGMPAAEFNMQFANAEMVPYAESGLTPQEGKAGKTFYKYAGPPAERDFCRQMLALDRFYTFEEIDTANFIPVNPGFGPLGSDTYDIWKYHGGPNCKHYWQKYYVSLEKGVQNKGRATGTAGKPTIEQRNQGYILPKSERAGFNMVFAEEGDKKILVGPAMVPNFEILRRDENGEAFYVQFSEDAVAKIAEKFMREQTTWNTNQDHDENKSADTYIFESWLIEDPETDKAKTVYGFQGLPKGTWMVKMRVNSEAVWQRVKNGELKGFSVEGNFISEEELKKLEDEYTVLEKIKEILK